MRGSAAVLRGGRDLGADGGQFDGDDSLPDRRGGLHHAVLLAGRRVGRGELRGVPADLLPRRGRVGADLSGTHDPRPVPGRPVRREPSHVLGDGRVGSAGLQRLLRPGLSGGRGVGDDADSNHAAQTVRRGIHRISVPNLQRAGRVEQRGRLRVPADLLPRDGRTARNARGNDAGSAVRRALRGHDARHVLDLRRVDERGCDAVR